MAGTYEWVYVVIKSRSYGNLVNSGGCGVDAATEAVFTELDTKTLKAFLSS